jgi:hypothetical protein
VSAAANQPMIPEEASPVMFRNRQQSRQQVSHVRSCSPCASRRSGAVLHERHRLVRSAIQTDNKAAVAAPADSSWDES